MDYWHSITVRSPRGDIIQRWAELEGKSPSMSADLQQRWLVRREEGRNVLAAVGVLTEVAATLLDAWRIFGSP